MKRKKTNKQKIEVILADEPLKILRSHFLKKEKGKIKKVEHGVNTIPWQLYLHQDFQNPIYRWTFYRSLRERGYRPSDGVHSVTRGSMEVT